MFAFVHSKSEAVKLAETGTRWRVEAGWPCGRKEVQSLLVTITASLLIIILCKFSTDHVFVKIKILHSLYKKTLKFS